MDSDWSWPLSAARLRQLPSMPRPCFLWHEGLGGCLSTCLNLMGWKIPKTISTLFKIFYFMRVSFVFFQVPESICCWTCLCLLWWGHSCMQSSCKNNVNFKVQQVFQVQIPIRAFLYLVTWNNSCKSLYLIFFIWLIMWFRSYCLM